MGEMKCGPWVSLMGACIVLLFCDRATVRCFARLLTVDVSTYTLGVLVLVPYNATRLVWSDPN